ncbi:MAG: hypothetical protein ABI673_00565 [Novosphingobium sp.]
MKNFRVLVYIKEPLVSLQLQLELDRMGVDTAIVHDYREAAVLARTLALSFAVIDSHTCDMGDHTLEQALVNRQVSFIALHDGDPYTPAIASRSIRVMSKPFLVEDMVAVIDEFRVDQAENKRCG